MPSSKHHQSRAATAYLAKYRAELITAACQILKGHPNGLSLTDLATALNESPHGLNAYLKGAPRISVTRRRPPDSKWDIAWCSLMPTPSP